LKHDTVEFIICSNCSSREYIENYPAVGKQICTKCGHESEKINLKIIEDPNEILDECPFCGKEGEGDNTFFEDDEILIFKCKKCGKLDGYRFIDISDFDYDSDDMHDSFSIKIAKNEGKFIHSASKCKELEKALRKKENDPVEKCHKRLNYLTYSILQQLSAKDIDRKIINSALNEAHSFIERHGPQTDKKLKCLFSAALLCASENSFTERQLEKEFGVTRKTIRKWKEILQNELKKEQLPFKLWTWALNTVGQSKFILVELPKELESIMKLEKPFKDKCNFCEEIELLSWRIQYVNGSWSNICERSYEQLNGYAKEYSWKVEDYLRS